MHDSAHGPQHPLLAPDEPAPFEIVNRRGRARLLLVCDHASNAIPRALAGLGLPAAPRRDHIAWDIGALDVSRHLSRRFDAPLIVTGYSRLVIDCNRHLSDPTAIAAESDGIAVPGNRGLSQRERVRRAEAIYHPYHAAIRELLDRIDAAHGTAALISVHSFTPVFQKSRRPWHFGVLWNEDERLAKPLLAALRRDPHLVIGDNEPYSARDGIGYTIAEHAEKPRRRHLSLEIRQDLIATADGAERYAGILGAAIAEALDVAKPARPAKRARRKS